MHQETALRTLPVRPRPNSSAVRYMAATRTPAAPRVMASIPTEEMSCISPRPAAPSRAER